MRAGTTGGGTAGGYASTDTYGDDPSELPREAVELSGQTVSLSAGAPATTCAVLVDGSLQCWGSNGQGALGLGHSELVGDDETPDEAGLSLVF